ncbi:MAG: Fe-S cluster assembly ATPase SufC [Pseudomonadota bacterium]|nr:Fe-S cluster assembly ATPase SufC [Pseudomonadota bacterium]MEC7830645.1 Fe-S cluster assembly ATPase SufC [Pseudomonadota bacterium]MEC9382613.1 Fe-S cluster assembly ATPase SufC [Pseudomonadota bacterium]MEC9414345.1 Fe-S cluster assembly ATPase SufC [Pseudomonadota bacterium]MEC9481369.1 Fe-S cluster assembly ATPase SufC [Pseudomonadota bacterium]
MSKNLLEISNLYVEAEGKKILKGLTLNIPVGEVHAIMGPNGSGKSVLSNVLSGKEDYNIKSGKIKFRGKDITKLPPNEISNLGLFMAFQYPVEIPGVTIMNFLKTIHESKRKANGLEPLNPKEFLKLVREKSNTLGIDDEVLKRQLNVGFSGGEKKRNEALQLLVLEPALTILDETDSGLDVDALDVVSAGIKGMLNKDNSLLIITHYKKLLDKIKVNKTHILVDGQIIKSGSYELAEEIERAGFEGLIK